MSPKKLSKAAASERRRRIESLVQELPEAACVSVGAHMSLEVRGKRFGWYLDDHHGDERLALNCKATPGAQKQLVADDADRFFVPKFVGHHGWIGVWLDLTTTDWPKIRGVLENAYAMTAPRSLLRQRGHDS